MAPEQYSMKPVECKQRSLEHMQQRVFKSVEGQCGQNLVPLKGAVGLKTQVFQKGQLLRQQKLFVLWGKACLETLVQKPRISKAHGALLRWLKMGIYVPVTKQTAEPSAGVQTF